VRQKCAKASYILPSISAKKNYMMISSFENYPERAAFFSLYMYFGVPVPD
jgi:hypothetical protein